MRNLESQLQAEMIKIFRLKYPKYSNCLFAIPNGGKRDVITAARLKKEGVTAGVWDLFFAFPHYGFGGLWLEVKVGKNKLTDHQVAFYDAMHKKYEMRVVRSVEEFIHAIDKYLSLTSEWHVIGEGRIDRAKEV